METSLHGDGLRVLLFWETGGRVNNYAIMLWKEKPVQLREFRRAGHTLHLDGVSMIKMEKPVGRRGKVRSDRFVELELHGPDLHADRFYDEKRGEGFQHWMSELLVGDELECYPEHEDRWQQGAIESFSVDGSGNASEVNCHFFLAWEGGDGEHWRYDLQDGLRVRLKVPTDDELRALPKWCEEMNWGEYPDQHTRCDHLGTRSLQPGGEHWYCPKHAPEGLE